MLFAKNEALHTPVFYMKMKKHFSIFFLFFLFDFYNGYIFSGLGPDPVF